MKRSFTLSHLFAKEKRELPMVLIMIEYFLKCRGPSTLITIRSFFYILYFIDLSQLC